MSNIDVAVKNPSHIGENESAHSFGMGTGEKQRQSSPHRVSDEVELPFDFLVSIAEYDEDMQEAGEEYAEMVDVPFEILEA